MSMPDSSFFDNTPNKADSGPPGAPKSILILSVLDFGGVFGFGGDADAPEALEAPPFRFLLRRRRVVLTLRDIFPLLLFDIISYL
jgi:hypothetical protein